MEEIFEKQQHFEVKISSDGYALFNDFKPYLKVYLSKFIQNNQPFEIVEEISKYRCVLGSRMWVDEMLLKLVRNEKICLDKKMMKEEVFKVVTGFSAEEFNELTCKDILEMLIGEIWDIG